MKKVLVVIVTYNGLHWIERCIKSVFNSTYPLTVMVIDNMSTDGTQAFVKSNYKDVIFYQVYDNLGFGRANNIGFKYAVNNDFDYVYLLNQDAWIECDTIEKLLFVHSQYSEYGILSPIQMNARRNSIDKNFALLCNESQCSHFLSDLYIRNLQDVYEISFVMAAHWLISRECFLKVGCFSPFFQHYGEDNDFVNRVGYWKFKIGIVPMAVAIHDREYRVVCLKKKMKYLFSSEYLPILTNINDSFIKSLFKASKFILKFFIPFLFSSYPILATILIVKSFIYIPISLTFRCRAKCKSAFLD